MRLNRFEDLQPIVPVRQGFRSGGIEFTDLMAGDEGDPCNYGLQLVRVLDRYSTPRHRHNFEQVRYMLDGSFGFGPGQVQHRGSLGYFCEGTYYTQAGEGPSTTLLLQIGGPTGQGFMSRRQLREGIDTLAARGGFEGGVYTWHDAAGKKHNQDSYEAVWEHVHGQPVRYPAPQYQGPLLMEPERFDWRPTGAVQVRELGVFNGCGLRLAQWRCDAGAAFAPDTQAQPLLLFCLDGSGTAGGRPYGRWSTVALERGESVTLKADAGSWWMVYGLPDFSRVSAPVRPT